MHYQLLVCLKGGELTGFEALLRWQHPQRGFVPLSDRGGIETENQLLLLLQNLGCDDSQGYLMSKPLQKDQMEKRLYKNRSWILFVVTDLESSKSEISSAEGLHVF